MRSRHAVGRFALGAMVATVLAGTTLSTPAWADAHADAVKAFTEGRKLRDIDPERAAKAFERSLALEPSIGAYYNLGEVNEILNRPREAITAFRLAEKLALQRGDARAKDAADAWGKILDTHNYVVVNVSEELKATPGLEVELDGVPVPDAQFNGEVFRPLATHEIVVRALRRKELRLAGVANKQPVTILLGEPTSGVVAPPTPTEPPQVSSGGWGWQKWTGAGMTVVGVAGVAYTLIGLFSYVGKEMARDTDRRRYVPSCTGMNGVFTACQDMTLTPEAANAAVAAYNANEQSATDAAPLWIGLGVGGALLIAGGVVLFATAPSAASEPPPPSAAVHVHVLPTVGIHDQGLSVVGTF
jgi:tetratricopeptide (TPR) repeat protein